MPKRTFGYPVCVGFMLLLLPFCLSGGEGHLRILYTNDLHAQFLPIQTEGSSGPHSVSFGGMVFLKAWIEHERDEATLLLDAGDTQTGTLLSRLSIDGARGGGFIQMMNRIGYHASVVGNHELDHGWSHFQSLARIARFDWLSANLRKGGKAVMPPYRVYSIGSLRVGVIGLTITPLEGWVSRSKLEGVTTIPPTEVAQALVDRIDPETDLIVLLTHQGFEADSLLASSLRGVDVIVGGHSHTVLKHPRRVNGILIVQAGSRGRYLGRLDLWVAQDRVTAYQGRLIPVRPDALPLDPEMVRLVREAQSRIEAAYGQRVGHLKGAWRRRPFAESAVGNWTADVIRETAASEFAVIHSGALRKDLGRGPIRVRDILELLPFADEIVRFRCTGRDLYRLIERNTIRAVRREEGILQVSGLCYTSRVRSDGRVEILQATLGGLPIDPERTYTGATVDYIAVDHALRYLGFFPEGIEGTGIELADAAVQWIRIHPLLSGRVEGRIRHLRDPGGLSPSRSKPTKQ